MIRRTGTLIFLCILLVGCSVPNGVIEIRDAWIRPADAGMNTAAYFVIENHGTADRLLEVGTTVAERTEIHRSIEDDTGVMRMEKQDAVMLPGGQSVTFEPGGLHIMFVELKRDLHLDDQVQLRLRFEQQGEMTIDVPIKLP